MSHSLAVVLLAADCYVSYIVVSCAQAPSVIRESSSMTSRVSGPIGKEKRTGIVSFWLCKIHQQSYVNKSCKLKIHSISIVIS